MLACFHLTRGTDRWLCFAVAWQNLQYAWNDILSRLLKMRNWGWKESSVVKSTGCFYRGTGFGS